MDTNSIQTPKIFLSKGRKTLECIDENVIGDVREIEPFEKLPQTANNPLVWQHIRKHGWSINPVTKLPRVIGLLLKLEELGLKGDIDAIKLYLDRTCGKQAEQLAVGLTQYEALSDQEILSRLKSSPLSNVVEHTSGENVAATSQENVEE